MNKLVLITGSSKGIGKQIAIDLKKAGYEILLHGRKLSDELLQISKDLACDFICFDVSNTQEAKAKLEEYCSKKGAFYGVVLNAGITSDATFVAQSKDDWFNVINTNLNSFYNVLNPILMTMIREKSGRIIVISSVSGIVGNRGQSNYAASKAGLIGAAKSLAIELASRNITVNVIAPGFIKTDMTKDVGHLDEIIKLIPAKRAGDVSEVSPLVEFLLSSKASYITKQVIGVNGGLC